MARTQGSIGLVKREFETDFWRWCHHNEFSPGEECAKLMKRAADRHDSRTFVQLAAVMLKSTDTRDGEVEAMQPTLIVDRSREPHAA